MNSFEKYWEIYAVLLIANIIMILLLLFDTAGITI